MPDRIKSLSMLNTEEGKMFLNECYGKLIENIQSNVIWMNFINREVSGMPEYGSYEVNRFVNSDVKNYGTARKNGAGQKVKGTTVVVKMDRDIELLKEVEDKDIKFSGIDNFITRVSAKHVKQLEKYTEKNFWNVACADGTRFVPSVSATSLVDKLDELIVDMQETKNQFVDGVDLDQFGLVLSASTYNKLIKHLDSVVNPNGQSYNMYHGVRCFQCIDLPAGVDAVAIYYEAMSQYWYTGEEKVEKVQFSEAYVFGIIPHLGCNTLTPDLVKYIKSVDMTCDTATATIAAGETSSAIKLTGATAKWDNDEMDAVGFTLTVPDGLSVEFKPTDLDKDRPPIDVDRFYISVDEDTTAGSYTVKIKDHAGTEKTITVTVPAANE